MKGLYITLRNFIKSVGTANANKAFQSYEEIHKSRCYYLSLYGERYKKTNEHSRLDLAEKVALFKYEIFKSLFKLNDNENLHKRTD